MTKWDYRIESTGVGDPVGLNDWLDELGERGWELVTLYPDPEDPVHPPMFVAVFKRPDPTQRSDR